MVHLVQDLHKNKDNKQHFMKQKSINQNFLCRRVCSPSPKTDVDAESDSQDVDETKLHQMYVLLFLFITILSVFLLKWISKVLHQRDCDWLSHALEIPKKHVASSVSWRFVGSEICMS